MDIDALMVRFREAVNSGLAEGEKADFMDVVDMLRPPINLSEASFEMSVHFMIMHVSLHDKETLRGH